MAKTKISEFSATPANNTDIDSINIAEGCAPSGINDAIRELMAQLKDFQTGAAGDSFNGPVGTTTAAAGSFTTLAYTGALTGGTGVVNLGSGQFYKDASGNVSVGTTNVISKLTVNGGVALNGGAGALGFAFFPYYNSATNYNALSSDGNGGMTFITGVSAPSVRATIDNSGNLLVGTTTSAATAGGLSLYNGFSAGRIDFSNISGATRNTCVFYYGATPTVSGSIQTASTSVSYNTSSDYRLKEDIQPMTGALATVAALKPVKYKWKVDGSDGQGFIAHELQEVVPDCVTGEKDAVDSEGKPVYQGIDTSFLVATLTAAIQEQQAIITALTARVEALESAAT